MALGIRHVLEHVAAQGSLDEGLQAAAQRLNVAVNAAVVRAKAALVPENFFVNERCQAIQLHQGVLQRRGGQQQLLAPGQCALERLPGFMTFAVGVAQFVGFVNHDHIPGHSCQLGFHAGSEMDGHDADDITVQRVVDAAFAKQVPGARIKHFSGQVEFVGQLLRPLLAQRSGANHQQASPALGPQLAQHQCSFNGFA